MECYVCGLESSKERLFEVVSKNGVIHLCSNCAKKENFPVVRRPTTFQLKEAEKNTNKGFYERVKEERERRDKKSTQNLEIAKREKQDVSLREIVDRNYEEKMKDMEKRPRLDLIDNFHWTIMRARRAKKISRERLAQEISESVAAIKMAEQGILPEDDYRIVNKIESFLNIRLRKRDFSYKEENKPSPARILKLDSETAKNLTIADLKKMKKMKESVKPLKNPKESEEKNEEIFKEIEEEKDKVEFVDMDKDETRELTEEEIDKIIFGK